MTAGFRHAASFQTENFDRWHLICNYPMKRRMTMMI